MTPESKSTHVQKFGSVIALCWFTIGCENLLSSAVAAPGVPSDNSGRYKKMEPKLDDTPFAAPKPFELFAQKKAAVVLNAEKSLMDLRANNHGTLLRGHVDQQMPQSAVITRERDVRATFHLDLRKLVPVYAPAISRLMDAQIAAARRRSAALTAINQKLMEDQLKQRAPAVANIPQAKPARINAHVIEEADARRRALEQSLNNSAKELARTRESSTVVSGATGSTSIPQPARIARSGQHIVIPAAEPSHVKPIKDLQQLYQTAGQISHKKVPAEQLSAELQNAKQLERNASQAGQSALDVLLTRARKIAPSISDKHESAELLEAQGALVIEWDTWHKKFAALAAKSILVEMDKVNNPAGENTVKISVSPNCRVSVKIIKPANNDFDIATLHGYQSLDGNPELKYPGGSRRANVEFLVDNKHNGSGVPAKVDAKTVTDDKEISVHR